MAIYPTQKTVAQIGVESTFGTSVAQTIALTHVDDITVSPGEGSTRIASMGDLAPATAHIFEKGSGSASLSKMATYGELGLWFQNLYGAATDAGAGPYTHTWEPDTTAGAPTRKFYTLMARNDAYAMACVSALITSLTLSFTPGEPVSVSADFVFTLTQRGRQGQPLSTARHWLAKSRSLRTRPSSTGLAQNPAALTS